MPVNYLHSLLHRVEDGWDPVPAEYACSYAELAWGERRPQVVKDIESRLGSLTGKRVLDLGGGPGQYSVLFAQHGADVTWYDISREYQAIARARASAAGVKLEYSLGYLEDASSLAVKPFDLMFCRVCWYYGRSDRAFARLVYSLVKPGGVGYVECNTPAFARPRRLRKIQYWLNEHFWWKIGHPMPPHGRIAQLLHQFDIAEMNVDYRSPLRDIVIFTKSSQCSN